MIRAFGLSLVISLVCSHAAEAGRPVRQRNVITSVFKSEHGAFRGEASGGAVVVTTSDEPAVGAHVRVLSDDAKVDQKNVRALDGNPQARIRQVDTVTTFPSEDVRGAYGVEGTYTSNGVKRTFTVKVPACSADCGWTNAFPGDQTRVGVRITAGNGAKGLTPLTVEVRQASLGKEGVTAVQSADAFSLVLTDAADPKARTSVVVADASDGAEYLTRWSFPPFPAELSGRVDLIATYLESAEKDAAVLDQVAWPAFFGAPTSTSVTSVAIESRGNEHKKLLAQTWAEGDDVVAGVDATLVDIDNLVPVATKVATSAADTVVILSTDPILFGGSAKGHPYEATFTLLAGDEVVATQVVDLTIAPGVEVVGSWTDGGAGLRKVGVYAHADGTWTLSTSVEGPDAERVDNLLVSLTPLAGGPYAKNPEVEGWLDGCWQTWVLPFKDPAGEAAVYGVLVDVLGEDGEPVDAWDWDDVDAQLGTGTRTSSTQASTKAELL